MQVQRNSALSRAPVGRPNHSEGPLRPASALGRRVLLSISFGCCWPGSTLSTGSADFSNEAGSTSRRTVKSVRIFPVLSLHPLGLAICAIIGAAIGAAKLTLLRPTGHGVWVRSWNAVKSSKPQRPVLFPWSSDCHVWTRLATACGAQTTDQPRASVRGLRRTLRHAVTLGTGVTGVFPTAASTSNEGESFSDFSTLCLTLFPFPLLPKRMNSFLPLLLLFPESNPLKITGFKEQGSMKAGCSTPVPPPFRADLGDPRTTRCAMCWASLP